VLLRTAKLSDSSEADLKKLVEEYNLATVLDFRSDMEITTAQDPDLEGVENLHLPIMDMELMGERYGAMKEELGEDAQNADQMTLLMAAVKSGIINPNMYVEFLQGQAGKDGYRRMFEELLALPEGKSLLFHCTQGKDRTGVGAMLILSALGVDQDTIMADYLLTNEFNAEKIAKEQEMVKQLSEDPQEQEILLLAMDSVNEETMRNALDYLNSEYGSPMGYITQELGLTEDQIGELQNKFLE
jgi:protein-tyrosine phosphatase